MAVSADAMSTDFSALDNAAISKEHWKFMLISGMGFFIDAYDLSGDAANWQPFVIYRHLSSSSEAKTRLPPRQHSDQSRQWT